MTEPTVNNQQKGIVWLASYPKCGNTWVRFMLSAALFGPPKDSIEVARRIHDIHRPVANSYPPGERPVFKTHFMLSDAHPHLNETARAIHIIRDPRDVILSALNYRKLKGDEAGAFTEAGYVKKFIAAGGDADWLRLGFGTWAQHARTWRSTDRFPVLALRYEDLKADHRGSLVRILEFLGEDVNDERIDATVAASTFEAMRSLEIREKQAVREDKTLDKRLFIGGSKATRKGVFFVNKGKSGQSLDKVSKGLDAQLEAAWGDQMREFGYL